jgi:transposase
MIPNGSKLRQTYPKPKEKGGPRDTGWREIMNGIFYIVKNGCVWRALPHDLPAWQTVYYNFRLLQKEQHV